MTSTLTPVGAPLLLDNFNGAALDTALWQPLAQGHEYKGQTWTPSSTNTYLNGGGFPTVSNNTARFALRTWDEAPNKKPDEHAFLGTEAISTGAWNPTTGGLAYEGRFKFSGDGMGGGLTQGGMILGFFSYDKNPTTDPKRLDFHTEIDFEVFTSNLRDPAKNQISTNVFNGSQILTIRDTYHNTNVNIAYDPLSFPNSPPPTEYHTYRFEWFSSWINFYIDGKLLRTVTNPDSLPDPVKDQNLHLNLWGQTTSIGYAYGDWTGNNVGDPSLGPARTAADAKTFFADFQAVRVDRLSSRLGTATADVLAGGADNDGIDGFAGNDTLSGLAGDDTIMGAAGDDTIDGGTGSDTALYRFGSDRYTRKSAGANVIVTDTQGGDGVDTLTNVEFLGFSDKVIRLGDGASNLMAGTAEADTFDALGGDDTLRGEAGNDTLMGNDGDDTIDAGAGTNLVSGGAGSDALNFRSGTNALRDTLGDMNGDAITGFGTDDALDIQGALIGRTALNVATTANAAVVSVGGSRFEMTGDFSGGEFMAVARGSGADEHTIVTFVPYLPTLTEGARVNTASINGVANEPFLFGDGSVSFTLELKSAVSAFHNTLGVYTVAADGTIGNVRILFGDTLNVADSARTVDLGTPAAGARLGFFLIQDGFDFYGQLPGDLSFVTPGTTAAANFARDTAITLHSAARGDFVATPIFHSHAGFNSPLGAVQVLSGVAAGGRELQIGFEDVATVTGDNDFQDVVFGIRASNDGIFIL